MRNLLCQGIDQMIVLDEIFSTDSLFANLQPDIYQIINESDS